MEDEGGYTALQWAVDNENTSAIEYLLGRDDLDLKHEFDIALAKQTLDVAKSLIARDDFNPNANRSLHSAILHEAKVIVGLLLARSDVDPNIISSGQTPLHLAIEKNDIEAIKLLLARGDLNPNITSEDRETPLEAAVSHRNREVVELLLTREDLDINRGNGHH